MNKKIYVTIATLGLAAGLYAEEVQFSDTPKAVQSAVNRNLNGGVVKNIDKKVKDGKTVYDVSICREGKDKNIRVDADGKLMASDSGPSVNITTDKNDGKLLGVLPAPSHDDKTVKGEANVGDHKVKIEGNADTQNRDLNAETHVNVNKDHGQVTVDTDSGKHKVFHKGDGKLLGFIPWKKPENKVEVEMKTDNSNSGAPATSARGEYNTGK